MAAPQLYHGVYCMATAKCIASKTKYPTDGDDALCYASWPLTYMNPAYDTCFGDTLLSMTRTYEVATAVTSSVLVFFLTLLLARVWVVRRAAKLCDMKRDAVFTSPVEHA
ncbi:hypothetical protein SDRG_11350 [Saprolegnia diclina VS20]|uniref:Uncharacterized protein n=1 Tax=Saprolegnia diclina (strain VS20) TaxID=1156394 RepID=T0PZ73_SAPDV|nr:hypothetical protein SDRG_11350 [Saprolegnia diclina VS20]EQC30869.1 hypothetical protein SDRG_11350 [Saprolegnia diclina VS20]|eukprot:XP_008615607.1 hypothetical protein SDRG_11350 [Saprolegnia diclina VS20]